jgi:tRNA(fMet)-specific endonuclease VapC
MLDTDVCVFFMNRKHPALTERVLARRASDLCISSITAAELAFGVQSSERRARNAKQFEKLESEIQVVPFDMRAAHEYGTVRSHLQGRGALLGPHDMLIASHAMALGVALVTNNQREFRRVPGLRLESWL